MLEEKDYLKKQINVLAKVLRSLLALVLKKGDNIEERLKESVDEEILGCNLDLWFNMNEVEYESTLKEQIDNPELVKLLIFIQLEILNRYFTENELDKSQFYFNKAVISKIFYDSISITYDITLETKYNQLKNVFNSE